MSSEKPDPARRAREPSPRTRAHEVPTGAHAREVPTGTGGREVSAGGVVVHAGQVLVIVPTRPAADGSLVLGLPKGHLDGGETLAQAATREVREETGVTAELVQELGEVRYWYVRDRRRVAKSVHFFLFRYLSGDLADHDDEVLEARWMDFEEACEALSYPGERDMVARALAIDGQDR
jgi:8-oxo-dGTP pyrophosphatase MutT (NUDIX family)